MTLKELELRLVSDNFPKDAYCLTGGLPNEAFTIEHFGGEWLVYYSERGQRSGLKTFETEQEATDYFYRLIARVIHPKA